MQGEGVYAGTPSVFVRTTGCNLRCRFCDTPYTSWFPSGSQILWIDVLQRVLEWQEQHVVITGGEPILQPEIVPLTQELKKLGRIITIETAGTVFRPVVADLISLSPKMSNSVPLTHPRWSERHRIIQHSPEVIRRWLIDYHTQLKFVIDVPQDLCEVEDFVREYRKYLKHPQEQIWLMPQATTPHELQQKESWLKPLAAAHGYMYTSRLHITWFGNTRGT